MSKSKRDLLAGVYKFREHNTHIEDNRISSFKIEMNFSVKNTLIGFN